MFLAAFFTAGVFQSAHAQGCVAARSNQGIMDELCGGGTMASSSSDRNPAWLRRLTVNLGFREFNSFRHFVGTDEQTQRELNHNQVENHQLIFDIGINYQISRRWSVIADVPVFQGSRNQVYSPVGVFRIGGIGDMQVGVQSWLFRPPTESNGNVAVSGSLKIPTGICDGKGSAVRNGETIIAVADQSLQPGDCRWGFTVATQAYRQIWFGTMLYFQIDDAQSQPKIPRVLEKKKITLPVFTGASAVTLHDFRLGEMLPATIVFDRDGSPAFRIMGEASNKDLSSRLDWLLSDRSSRPPKPLIKNF
jgi:hypothetical protein